MLLSHRLFQQVLLQRKRNNVVAHFGSQLSVSTGTDNQILLAANLISHRRRLRARGKFHLPNLFTSLNIKSAEVSIHRGGYEHQPSCSHRRTAKVERAPVLRLGKHTKLRNRSKRHFPLICTGSEIDRGE